MNHFLMRREQLAVAYKMHLQLPELIKPDNIKNTWENS